MSSPQILNLNIGEMIVTEEDVIINTTLGSCVSVCVFVPNKKAAGIIHYALPYFLETSATGDELKYGEHAIPALIEEVAKLAGVHTSFLKAKIVGGANCFIRTSKGGMDDIGEQNIKIGLELLKYYKVTIIGEHLGGPVGRKVIFHTLDGRLLVASLTPS